MRNALNPLNELSDIYLGSINEEDNSPEAIKARVMQHVRAIRYRARKEGINLIKHTMTIWRNQGRLVQLKSLWLRRD